MMVIAILATCEQCGELHPVALNSQYATVADAAEFVSMEVVEGYAVQIYLDDDHKPKDDFDDRTTQ